MLQRILVPLDGSARAEYALPVAARLAHATGGTLILLQVYQVLPSEFVLSDYTAEAAPAAAYLADIATREDLAGITIETITLAGAVARTILDAVLEYQVDTIVLCSHGRSGPTRWALGSVAEKVARHAPVPVLVLRKPHDVFPGRRTNTERPLRTLVALDGSSFAEAALAPAAQMILALAAPAPGALHLVQGVRPSANIEDRPYEQDTLLESADRLQGQAQRDAQDYLHAVAERVRTGELAGSKLQVTWSVAVAEDVAATLVQLAEEREDTVLIALASHGRGGLQRWALGSVAERCFASSRGWWLSMINHTNPEPEPSVSAGISQSGGSSQLSRIETAAGLSTQEATRRLQQYGPNVVAEERTHPWLAILRKFWAPVPWMLELAIVLELVLGKFVEAVIIAVLLLFNGAVSAVQERRAHGALALLRHRLTILARVQRDDQWQTVPASALVPGDMIHLRVGDVIPADVRLAAGQLFVDQSALTGESLPVDIEPGNTAYAGTAVKRGEATGEVTATGASTFFGKTAELVRTAKTASHLERIILQIVQYLVGLDALLLVAVLGYALVMHISLAEILPFALVLLIASVPVALPATFTLTTSLGAQELARSGILVTRLSAIEEAAGMDVLCSDKTGTMTQNQLAVEALRAYPPTTSDNLLQLASFACDEATQDPIDLAILKAARERHLLPADAQRLGFVPFDPGTKRSEATVRKARQVLHIVKGAPQVIADLAGTSWTSIATDVETLASRGFRILAVAAGADDTLQLIGLVALTDPPRPDSRQLVQSLQDLGVRVLMVTGDSEATARMVATEVGIGMRSCSPAALRENPETAVATSDVFAGVFPEDKIHLIQALQRSGHVVGMTGDGVNDAPALKQAEVGIAVASATDVAKAAASLVLTSAGLGNMVAAVELSRRIYQRMLTYTLNMSIKKISIPLFLSLGLLFSGVFVTNARLMVLMLFANDVVTMSITTDRVSPAGKPEHWATRSLIMAAFSLALPLLLLDFGVFWVGHTFIQLALPQVQTFVFVWLVLSGQLTVYLVREQHHFWRSRPSRWLLISSIADVVIFSLLATQGWLMAAIPMYLVAALLFLGLIYLVGADFLKVRIFHCFQVR